MSWFGGAAAGGGGGGFDDNDVASLRQQLALEREGKAKLSQMLQMASGGNVLSDLQHQLNTEKAERTRAATLLAGKGIMEPRMGWGGYVLCRVCRCCDVLRCERSFSSFFFFKSSSRAIKRSSFNSLGVMKTKANQPRPAACVCVCVCVCV